MRRVGDKFQYGESADGKKWQIGKGVAYDLPDTLRVGVVAINTSSHECEATFSDFTVIPLKSDK